MRKKGFTLIELLAVIILLAIVSIIATPMVLNVVEKAKKSSFEASVNSLLEACNLFLITHNNPNDYDEDGNLIFTCTNGNCTTPTGTKLPFKGEVNVNGQIIATKDGKLEVNYLKNGDYCSLGSQENMDVQKDCTKLDITDPIVEVVKVKETTNSIIINVQVTDIESGVKKIEYKIDEELEVVNYNGEATLNINKEFKNLSNEKEYKIIVTVTNGNGKAVSKEVTGTTLNIETATVVLTNTPETALNGYLNEQEATIEYTGTTIENPYYYVKTTRSAKATATTESCGTSTLPEACSKIDSTTTLLANTWYRYANIPTIIYNEPSSTIDTLYVAIGDGNNIGLTTIGNISKIFYESENISYTNEKNNITNVKEALDDLYDKIGM